MIGKYAYETNVYLYNYDLTQDVYGVNTVTNIVLHLHSVGVPEEKILVDPRSLGEHTVVWFDGDVRCKVYNKTHQMLTSCAVRKSYGSLVNLMFVGSSALSVEAYMLTKETSMTRFEITLPYMGLGAFVNESICRWQLYGRFL